MKKMQLMVRHTTTKADLQFHSPNHSALRKVPLVTSLAGNKLQEHGLPNVMMGVMQLQAVGQQDPVVGEGVQILTAATMGNPPADDVIAAYLAKLG